ncbi:hypothetical protein BOO69_04825 [Sulfitobacter alexandrii]|uniref:Uncharacterized protein n=1 Tax=Sulfitobacter alexandrii TaxID=1917485 RepID=A0A1J0WEU1_9RHOB|nr:hypothetical protein [Sulfitobacter alexandrii]APE42819.1 hypothetical protein BOO69_04825 [Sulfitobacter alexandrii]
MTNTDLRAENDRLRARLSAFERAAEENNRDKRWYSDNTWQDWVKLSGLPLAFVLACYTFYDDVYLRYMGRDSATLGTIESNLREIQKLNEKAYALNESDSLSGAQGFEAANLGLRQRLASQTFGHWQDHPGFFQPAEAQILADQLLLLGRTRDAWAVAETLDDGARSASERVELALFRGRILGAEGDAFDLDAARKQLGEAYALTDEVAVSSRALALRRMILQYRVHMELYYEQPCDKIGPLVEALEAWTLDGTPAEDAQDRNARRLIETYTARCAG